MNRERSEHHFEFRCRLRHEFAENFILSRAKPFWDETAFNYEFSLDDFHDENFNEDLNLQS